MPAALAFRNERKAFKNEQPAPSKTGRQSAVKCPPRWLCQMAPKECQMAQPRWRYQMIPNEYQMIPPSGP
jgi:hypothetical protein